MMHKVTMRQQDEYGKANAVATETFSNVRTVLAFGGQKEQVDKCG